MFSKFKILVIYLIIPSRCANIPSPSNEKLTLSFKEQVKQELDPLQDSLKKIIDPLTSNDEKLELRGVIQGVVKKIIEQAIIAEYKVDQLNDENGELKNKLELISNPLRILSVRSRLETLVDDLYPVQRPFHIGVTKAFEEILTSTHPKFTDRSCIKIFRERVREYGISAQSFVDAVRPIYGSFSDKVAHKMLAFEPQSPLYNDKEGIKKMLMDSGITADDAKVSAIQIILQPLPLSK